MTANSLEEVLQRLRAGNVTQGWGAVCAFSRLRLNRLLEQQYIERLDELRFIPSFSGTVTHQGLTVTHSRLTAVEFGAPRLSFSTASMDNSRARLTMNIIGGRCTHASSISQSPVSSHLITEAMGFTLEMDIDLALVTGEVDRRGRVVLDLAEGASLRCNLGGDEEQVSKDLSQALEQWFKALPKHCSVFELGMIDFDGYSALTPVRFIIRTQAAPGAKLASAANYGDGAVLTFIQLVANDDLGDAPDDRFPFLIPSDTEADGRDRYSAVLVLDQALLEHVSDERLDVLASVLFPGSHAFKELARHTPHDLAVFGSIDPLRTTFTLEPAIGTLRAGQSQKFVLRDGTGKALEAKAWRAVGLRSHTAASQGSIDAAGLYKAASEAQVGHDSLTVLVTADYEEAGVKYSASARLQVFFEGLEIAPRIATCLPSRQSAIRLTAADPAAKPIDWTLHGTRHGELLEAGDNQVAFRASAASRRRSLNVQHIQARASEASNAAVLLLNGQQALAVTPGYVPRVKAGATVQVQDNSGLLPGVARRWRVEGEGTVDAEGRFTAPANARTGSSVVVCEVVRNGVVLGSGYSLLQYSQLTEEETWDTVQSFKLLVPGGPQDGSVGGLLPNGYQPMKLEMVVETHKGGKPIALSEEERGTLGLYHRASNAAVGTLPGKTIHEGISPDDPQLWRTNLLANRFQAAINGGAAPAPAQDDEGTYRTELWLHSRAAVGTITPFYARFQADSGAWHSSTDQGATAGGVVQVTARTLPEFTAADYTFERVRVDGGVGNEGDPPNDDFDFHPRTVDYWKLKYTGGGFETCEFLPVEAPVPQKIRITNTSMLRWEIESKKEIMTSFTGYIFRDSKKPGVQTKVLFDESLAGLVNSSYMKDVAIDENFFEVGSLVISNHRYDDIDFKFVSDKRKKVLRSLAVLMRDRQGNAHSRRISFAPASANRHRDKLSHTLFTPPPEILPPAAELEHAVGVPDTESNGRIELAQKLDQNGAPDGYTTSVEIKNGYVKFGSDDNPKNDVISYIKMDNVPSAVQIGLTSERAGDHDGDWYFAMRTTNYRTSTGWIEIKSLKGRPVGDIVRAGLRMEVVNYDHGNIEGKLSGIYIDL
ncbi:Imidazoleglycerol-phosphate synthase [Pseudomonas reidholzensis]|uniref:Imidazoleglycerol-phosphate synthase n=2 Tax=Pseudomonas reidholzensis TaxID=1785162 RepID=A0A383RYB8_9PSED|nr:Imidazoleglycerol-phosphate synthase [Pseudomonas reidholzensis]